MAHSTDNPCLGPMVAWMVSLAGGPGRQHQLGHRLRLVGFDGPAQPGTGNPVGQRLGRGGREPAWPRQFLHFRDEPAGKGDGSPSGQVG